MALAEEEEEEVVEPWLRAPQPGGGIKFRPPHPVLWIRIRSDPKLFAGSSELLISDPDPTSSNF